MGCDIHALIEVAKPLWRQTYDDRPAPVRWRCAGEPDIGRNYDLFTALAGVRDYGEGITAIQTNRGLPDIDWMSEAARAMLGEDNADLHSHGYVTLAEMKAHDVSTHPNLTIAWNELIDEMELALDRLGGAGDEACRLVFAFDN